MNDRIVRILVGMPSVDAVSRAGIATSASVRLSAFSCNTMPTISIAAVYPTRRLLTAARVGHADVGFTSASVTSATAARLSQELIVATRTKYSAPPLSADVIASMVEEHPVVGATKGACARPSETLSRTRRSTPWSPDAATSSMPSSTTSDLRGADHPMNGRTTIDPSSLIGCSDTTRAA